MAGGPASFTIKERPKEPAADVLLRQSVLGEGGDPEIDLRGRDSFAVHRRIAKTDGATGVLLFRINVAAIEGSRIDVQADGAFLKFAWVIHFVHGRGRIDRARTLAVHLHRVGLFKTARAFL